MNSSEVILVIWVVVSMLLYARLDPCRATLVAMLGGWAVLPNLPIGPAAAGEVQRTASSIHALAIPDLHWFNKATAIGIGGLLGSLLFARKPILHLRPRWFDWPLALFLLAPFASGVVNRASIARPLFQVSYLAIAWGVPYLLGRAHFSTPGSLLHLARAWVIAGLLYIPVGLSEFVAGPFLHSWLYGWHPYRFDGAGRWVGYRPVGFLEQGNQFGIWTATAAIAAVWLWSLDPSGCRNRLPGRDLYLGIAAFLLVTTCLLWQSHSSIALMLLCFLPLFTKRIGIKGRVFWAGVAGSGGVAMAIFLLAVGSFGVQELRLKIRGFFHGIDKRSFTWRLARMEDNFSQILQRPWFGWGIANWSGGSSDGAFVNPIALSLWFLQWGMFGFSGLLALAGLLLLPLLRALNRLRHMNWDQWPASPAAVTTVILVLNVAELGMNSLLILPILLAAGGLSSWTCRALDDRLFR